MCLYVGFSRPARIIIIVPVLDLPPKISLLTHCENLDFPDIAVTYWSSVKFRPSFLHIVNLNPPSSCNFLQTICSLWQDSQMARCHELLCSRFEKVRYCDSSRKVEYEQETNSNISPQGVISEPMLTNHVKIFIHSLSIANVLFLPNLRNIDCCSL